MAVQTAQPERLIRHDLEIKSPLDATRWQAMLTGPRLHSHTRSQDGSGTIEEARFNWYSISETPALPSRGVSVALDGYRERSVEFELGKAVYFLSTALKLSDGKPTRAPDKLSNFIAYDIRNRVVFEEAFEVDVTSESQDLTMRLVRPIFLCLPAEVWHHDEYHAVHDAGFCLVVFPARPFGPKDESKTGTLDEFGLNSLQLNRAELVAVTAKRLKAR